MKESSIRALLGAALMLLGALPGQNPAKLQATAWKLLGQRKFAEALPLVEQALKLDARNADLLHMRASCKGHAGEHQAAIKDSTAALTINPKHAGAFAERAFNYYQLEQLEKALADYDRALAIQPDAPMTHGERGDLLLDLRRAREAIAAFDRAIELAPRWFNAHSQRGRAAQLLADFEMARVSFQKAVRLDRSDPYALLYLASAEFDCNRGDEALRDMRRLATMTKDMWYRTLRGRLAWQLDEYEIAKKDLTQAVNSKTPRAFIEASLSLGSMHIALGEFEAARKALTITLPEGAPAGYRCWFALMKWCADYAGGKRDGADKRLHEVVLANSKADDPVRNYMQICANLAGTPAIPPSDCAGLFFAGWRALADGDTASAEKLLLLCINTGAKDYQQWQVARTILLQRLGKDALTTCLPVQLKIEQVDGQGVLKVQGLKLDSVNLDGLRPGDIITQVSGAPVDTKVWPGELQKRRVGHDVHVTVLRDGKPQDVSLRLAWRRRQ